MVKSVAQAMIDNGTVLGFLPTFALDGNEYVLG
jgi:hypothetical protein